MTALERLAALGADTSDAISLTSPGAPISKARARHDRRTGRAYTPATTRDAQDALSWQLAAAARGHRLTGMVAIACVFYRPNYQRIDADNLMKLVMDAATNAGIWPDDCYVAAQAAFIELDPENPRTEIAIATVASTLDRTRMFTCTVCESEFARPGLATFKSPPKTCSRACRAEVYRRDRGWARCPMCDREFARKAAGQTYCSRSCAARMPNVRKPTDQQRPWPTCSDCGGRVSRREYLRCSDCTPKGRKRGSKNRPKVVPTP